MAWDKTAFIDTHTLTQAMIDKIMSMGPRGYEFLNIAGGGSIPAPGLLTIDAALAETLLARGPRAAFMAQVITGDTPVAGDATIINLGNNRYRIAGLWDPGTIVDGIFSVTDPDDQSNNYPMSVTIPEGAPEPGWPPATATTVICGAIDALTHIRCEPESDTTFEVVPAAPSNSVRSALSIRG